MGSSLIWHVGSIIWSSGTPNKRRILAMLSTSFTHTSESYPEILFARGTEGHYTYYDYSGEEVPVSATERWVEV